MAALSGEPKIKQGWLRAVVFFIVYVPLIIGLYSLLQYLFQDKETLQKSVDAAGAMQELMLIIIFLVTGFSFFITWLFRKFIDKQSFYSLGFAQNANDSATGALAAVAMLGIGTLLLMFTGRLSFTGVNGGAGYLGMNLLLMLLIALMEEITFRGYILNNLMQSIDKWVALAISAVFFTIVHMGNEGAGVLPMIEIFIGGIMLGINYIFTRNLWFGIALHFTWNFLQGPLLGYEVSGNNLPSLLKQEINGPVWLTGGAFGFEGSVLAMLLNIALIGLLIRVYKKQNPVMTS